MEMEKTALNMSLPYQIMLKKFEKSCDNAGSQFNERWKSLFFQNLFKKTKYILNLLNKIK